MPDHTPRGKFSAMLHLKCPRCRRSDLFHTPTFSFRQPFDMKDRCDVCDLNYMPEPGYYYGSMYISYIILGWFCLAFMALFHWVLGWSTNLSFGLLVVICAVLFVYTFRVSRSIWLGINVRYDPIAAQKSINSDKISLPE